MTDYRILITGTREELTDQQREVIRNAVSMHMMTAENVVIVHGGCPTGVDAYVDKIKDSSWPVSVESHPADWSQGKIAGPKRNQEMVELGADLCLAFPKGQSRGTRGCIKMAKAARIPTIVTELI